jgi:hypothetical protein
MLREDMGLRLQALLQLVEAAAMPREGDLSSCVLLL